MIQPTTRAQPKPISTSFDYNEAFKRNLGILSEADQEKIKQTRIGLTGLGGVGSILMTTYARLGFERFHIADVDGYELANFNRQFGATLSSIGQHKVDVMSTLTQDINPNIQLKAFKDGISEQNLDAFLDGVDLVLDSIDLYEMGLRRLIFNRALAKNIPVITAGPIGMGTCYLTFLPGGPNFDEFIGVQDDTPPMDCMLRFLMRLSPEGIHWSYFLPDHIELTKKKVPSLSIGSVLAAGVSAGEALKIVLGRGQIDAVPLAKQFDVFTNQFITTDASKRNKPALSESDTEFEAFRKKLSAVL